MTGPPDDQATAPEPLVDITVTAGDADWLAGFTRRLVQDGVVACGNIVAGVRSIYAWDGAVEDTQESLVILHTRATLAPYVVERTVREHPYDEPQVLVLPVASAAPGYHRWVLDTTQRAAGGPA